ncbi:MAG TPA: fibronectin type III domain-containing protein [Mycobacteriales bacterium]|jgi:hypothetical protein|nr:fibronectin type III domain-containing protein [Mycobacteriales bacterium]
MRLKGRSGVLAGAGAAGAVALLVGVAVASSGGGDRPAAVAEVAPTVTSPRPATAEPSPSPRPSTTAPASAAPTTAAAVDADAPTVTSPRPATADPARAPGGALPTGCLSFGHACAYPGATGAVTGGVEDMTARLAGPSSVAFTWRSVNLQGHAGRGAVTEFVVRAYVLRDGSHEIGSDPSRLVQLRVPASATSATLTGLRAGTRYFCWVQELNSSGLSPGMGVDEITTPAPPSPSRTPTATPTPSATPSATPTATPSASASA